MSFNFHIRAQYLKCILFLISFTIFTCSFYAQTIISKKNGKWSSSATWVGGNVPTSTDNVVIDSKDKVQIDGNFACNDLTIGTSSTQKAVLEFVDNTAHSFTVFGNVLINIGDTFDIKKKSNTTHTVTFYGDIVNDGGIQFNYDALSKVVARFAKNGNQSISGSASFSKFYNIQLNMGNSSNNILDVTVSNFTVPVNFLTLNNGTFKISTTNAQTITPFANAVSIPNTAGLWLNTSSVLVNCLNNVTSSGPITIDSGTLAVAGNLINNGIFTQNAGLVLLNGNSSQSLGGSNIYNFFDLTLNNTSGAILNNTATIKNVMQLNNGTFNTNSQSFTLLSSAASTARIAQITGTGDIIGNVRVQRFVPGGATGWALWGTPISSALTFADWDDNIPISCPTCPDGYVPNFISIYSYDETAVGSYSDFTAYVPMNTINDPIIPNRGYWVYVGDGQYTTNGITVDVTGAVRKGNQTIPLGYTNTSSVSDDGWNLIHNPYPSPISWAALRNGNANVDNAIYCFNADLNGGSGASATYVNGVSSPAVGSGGIGDAIPMSQGFYVHATANTNLTGQESNKVASTQAYLRSASQNPLSLLRVNLNGGPYNFSEESVIYFEPAATTNFDDQYDAYKIAGQDPYVPYMAMENGSEFLQINGIPQVVGTFTTYLKTLSAYNGTYSITSSENSLPVGACVSLYDRFTSTITDLTSSDYVFNLSDTTTVARFILSITINSLQVTSNVTQPTCQNIIGEINIVGNSSGPWNYYWKDGQGNPIKTSLNKSTADTLYSLINGNYQVDVTTVGGCDNNNSSYSIIGKINPTAGFSFVDTCYINIDPIVVFYNQSSNLVSQLWNFGDSNSSTYYSPQHQYQTIGNYNVSLLVNSSTGCTDTVSKNIVVMNKPVGIKTESIDNNLKVRTLLNNRYVIEQELNSSANLSYNLKDSQGRLILEKNKRLVNQLKIDLDLSNYEVGIYFLSIKLDEKISTLKLTVSN